MNTNPAYLKKKSEILKGRHFSNNGTFVKGHRQSEQARLKMSIAKKGKTPGNKKPDAFITCLWCKTVKHIIPAHIGRAKYCSKPCADRGKDRGLTNEQKKLRTSIKYAQWRKSVFERDDYTCQQCFTRGGKLNADHIKRFADYPELRFDTDNGRTLCEDCHRATPTYGNRMKAQVF